MFNILKRYMTFFLKLKKKNNKVLVFKYNNLNLYPKIFFYKKKKKIN